MKKEILGIILLSSLLGAAGCTEKSAIEGRWAVDLDATVANGRSVGGSDHDIQQVREIYGGGLTDIDADKISFGINDMKGAETRSYKVDSKAGSCLILRIEANPDLLRFCVDGGRMEVHDPSTKLVVVYKRT